MNLYRVRVKASWTYALTDTNVGEVTRVFLVEASDSVEALETGEHAAMVSAMIGPRWLNFRAVEASTVTLPLELGSHPKLKPEPPHADR